MMQPPGSFQSKECKRVISWGFFPEVRNHLLHGTLLQKLVIRTKSVSWLFLRVILREDGVEHVIPPIAELIRS